MIISRGWSCEKHAHSLQEAWLSSSRHRSQDNPINVGFLGAEDGCIQVDGFSPRLV